MEDSCRLYNYFRDYDSAIGRYVEREPIGLQGGLNTFAYAANNPLTYADPEGLNPGALALPAIPSSGGAAAAGAGGTAVGGAAVAGGIAVAGAGIAGYGLGSWIYPHIAIPLGDAIDAMCKDNDREKRCDHQYYEVDIPTCRAISRSRGKAAGARCYAAAAQRYAACLRGQSLPPLDTWNN